MIYCKECGTEISSKAKSCPKCGADIRSWWGRRNILTKAFVVFFGLIFLAGVLEGLLGGNEETSSKKVGTTSYQKKEILIDETRKIDATGYWYAGWKLPRGTHITGRLSVQDKDVDFYLIKGDRELESFKRLETFYHLSQYSKKDVQVTTFDFVVPEKETYYFVASNIDSLTTAKYATFYIEAEY